MHIENGMSLAFLCSAAPLWCKITSWKLQSQLSSVIAKRNNIPWSPESAGWSYDQCRGFWDLSCFQFCGGFWQNDSKMWNRCVLTQGGTGKKTGIYHQTGPQITFQCAQWRVRLELKINHNNRIMAATAYISAQTVWIIEKHSQLQPIYR